jgi:FkbM family methyltransferase
MNGNKKEFDKIKYKSKDVDLLVNLMIPLVTKVENDFTNGISIYGAGFIGKWACEYLISNGASVTYFIDRDPQKEGSFLNGVEILLPTDPILSSVSSMVIAARHAIDDVSKAMTNYHFNLVSFDCFYVVKNYKKLCFVRDNFFSDEKSVNVFNALLIAMLTGSTTSCRAVMEKDMYFCIPEFSGTFNETFVDAGAFVGDTVERFLWENLGTFKHIYAFEPGLKQFSALQKRMHRLSEEWAFDMNCVTVVKAGLSSKKCRMSCSFLGDSPLRHGLITENPFNVADDFNSAEVFSLDSFLDGKEVTFIKADVEGMEMELLKGAQETICRFRPKMALCIYHYPSDLFEIAEFVRKLVPEYKFYLRHHAPIFGDFVLYCYVD